MEAHAQGACWDYDNMLLVNPHKLNYVQNSLKESILKLLDHLEFYRVLFITSSNMLEANILF